MTLIALLTLKVMALMLWAAFAPKSFLKSYTHLLEHGSKVWKTLAWVCLMPFKLVALRSLGMNDDKYQAEVEDLKDRMSE